MNSILALTLIITCVLAVAGLAILGVVIAGIHREERHLSLPEDPGSPVDTLARRVLGVHVSLSSAGRVIATRYAPPPPGPPSVPR